MNRRRPRWHWLVLLIPYGWDVAAVPSIAGSHRFVGVFPLLYVWMLAGIIVTSLSIALVYLIDRRTNGAADAEER